MKNMRAVLMLLIAAAAGLTAVVFASRWMMNQASTATTKVIVATADIDLGQRITPESVKAIDWPSGSVPPGSFSA
jgi:pilus assembly protein CpaB